MLPSYEARSEQLLPRARFLRRLSLHAAFGAALLMLSLLIGIAGYRSFEQLAWSDAFLNAAMLLGGMGPVNAPASVAGKIFAGIYALYSGLVFLVTVGVVLAPVLHRLLHKFHAEGRATGS